MKIIILSIFVISVIGLIIPDTFAEETHTWCESPCTDDVSEEIEEKPFISINEVMERYEHWTDIWINGHVKFSTPSLPEGHTWLTDEAEKENEIKQRAKITIKVTSSDGKIVFSEKKQLSSSKPLPNSSFSISPFQFLIPNESFVDSDRYTVEIYFNSLSGLIQETTQLYVGIDSFMFEEKTKQERQLHMESSTSSTAPPQITSTSTQNTDSYIWISVIIIFVVIIGFLIRIISRRKRPRITRFGISEDDLRNNFSRLDDEFAEELVGELFRKKGYTVTVGVKSKSGEMKKTGDFGIDVRAQIKVKNRWGIKKSEYLGIQVKHWENNVGFEDAAKTMGVSDEYDKVIIVSTKSDFSRQVYENKSSRKNWKKLELWNSEKFKDELRTYLLR